MYDVLPPWTVALARRAGTVDGGPQQRVPEGDHTAGDVRQPGPLRLGEPGDVEPEVGTHPSGEPRVAVAGDGDEQHRPDVPLQQSDPAAERRRQRGRERHRHVRAGGKQDVGVARQLVAIAASGDRTAALRSVAVPALVLHGADDPLVAVSGGQATARAIPGAEFVAFEGMGHDLPRPLWGEITRRIAQLVARADGSVVTRP